MNIKNMDRRRVERIVLGIILGLIVCVLIAVPCISYAQYMSYYNSVINKGGADGPTIGDPVLKSISVHLADGKEFFDNGKASPVKSDFVVEGTYKISEEESYTDRIDNADFTLEVPTDFTQNGGEIVVKSGEFTASMNIVLTPVKLSSLYLLTEPYIVAYREGDVFSTDGMSAEARYNDGTVVKVGTSYVLETVAPLTAGTEKVTISYTLQGEKVTCDVPVTVKKASEFSNGNIVSLAAEGDVFVQEGSSFSAAEVSLRATYESGNRILLTEDDYTIVNAEEQAYLGDKAYLEIEAISGITLQCPLKVVSHRETETGDLTGGQPSEIGVTLSSGAVLKLSTEATNTCAADLHIYLKDGADITYSQLNRILGITVNGAVRSIDGSVELTKDGRWTEITVNGVKLYKGNNTIAFTNTGDGSIEVDWVKIASDGGNASAITLGEYTVITESPEYVPELISGANPVTVNGFTGLSGACTDGVDLYYAFTDDNNVECYIVRYSLAENGVAAKSEKFRLTDDVSLEEAEWKPSSANLAYIDGKIYVLRTDGSMLAFDAQTLSQTVCGITLPDYSVDFESGEEVVTSIQYNEKMQRYAVAVKEYWWAPWAHLYIYDKDFRPIVSNVKISAREEEKWGGYNCRGLFGGEDYLYALYSEDASEAVIAVFDWNGNMLTETTIGGMNPYNTDYCNVENMAEVDGVLYVGVYSHGGVNGGSIYKIELERAAYSVSAAEIVAGEGGAPLLKITGSVSGYGKEDFTLVYDRLDPWPWVRYGVSDFEMSFEDGTFTVTCDLSFLIDTDDKNIDAETGKTYQKYFFYFNLNDEESAYLPKSSDLTTFSYGGWTFETYNEWGAYLALKITAE